MPVLIIEGPDLAGKSTAIEKLSKHFNAGIVIKNSYKPKASEDTPALIHQYNAIISVIEKYNTKFFPSGFVILDRFFPSQLVYSYKRGIDELEDPPKDLVDIEKYCVDNKFIYIYVWAPLDVLKQRLKDRGDEHVTEEELSKLLERYDHYFDECAMKKVLIDTQEENWLEKLSNFINEA